MKPPLSTTPCGLFTATETRLREEARATPAGQLLARMGMDYWDTESMARRVAEHAAQELAKDADIATFARVLLAYYRERTRKLKADYQLDDEASNNIESAIYHAAHGDLDEATKRLLP